MLKQFATILIMLIALAGCKNAERPKLEAKHLHQWNEALQAGIINDFFNPPVAGRMYTYPNLIAYSVLTNGKNNIEPNLKNFPILPQLTNENRELVALYAFYFVAKKMIYSFNFLDKHLPVFEKQLSNEDFTDGDMEKAKIKAEEISKVYMGWVARDGYKESRSDTKFTLSHNQGRWKPTPTEYADALEPNWKKIRPFLIDSASQFTAKYSPYPFNINDKNSAYYKELLEVKEQVDQTNKEQLATSKYWDCNPLAPRHNSHATFAEKKLTPGGHWMAIGRNISTQQNDDLPGAAKMYATLALSINDGFIACWQSKYHYDYIRPVTAINEHWDSKWKTLILTPNFPEYPSGHSVVSGVASTILASIYGDNISFTDNAEEPFGMTPRKFTSFSEACDQAAMSRFWAGIHYKKAILDGVKMGREIGDTIVNKLKKNNAKS